MINTQKLIILNVVLALFTGLVMSGQFYLTTIQSNSEITSFISNTQRSIGTDAMNSDDVKYGDVKTENPVSENRIGNAIVIGAKAFGLFLFGLLPIGFPWYETTGDNIAFAVGIAYVVFRTTLLIITIIDVYFVYFNKKTS